MKERFLLKNKHDFTFTTKINGKSIYTCIQCGMKTNSHSLYMMDREECLRGKNGASN